MISDPPQSVELDALVADFEHWSAVAERKPVFITQDGREAFVLMSVDYYDQLLERAGAPRSGPED